jgi:hypothetical protein
MAIGFSSIERLPAVLEVIETIRAVHPALPVLAQAPAQHRSALPALAGPTAWSCDGTESVYRINAWAAHRRP